MVYARFIKELSVQEEFLFCHPLSARNTEADIFKALNDFIQENYINWSRCCGICTDGARAMTGRHSGLVKQVQAVEPAAVWSHCIILDCVQQVVIAHLQGFVSSLETILEETLANQWVRNPFFFPVTSRDGLTLQEEEALVKLNSYMDLKQKISEVSLAHFWLSVETEFPHLTKKAVKVFIPFISTYLCEWGFSALTMIKSIGDSSPFLGVLKHPQIESQHP